MAGLGVGQVVDHLVNDPAKPAHAQTRREDDRSNEREHDDGWADEEVWRDIWHVGELGLYCDRLSGKKEIVRRSLGYSFDGRRK